MKFLFTFCLISLLISGAFCVSPVFLSAGGSTICTLNNVGSVPASNNLAVKYPVYRKVCRAVVPTALGDQVDDEEINDEEEIASASKQLRRAIIQQ
jgi:Na+/H+ antiporter NhaB